MDDQFKFKNIDKMRMGIAARFPLVMRSFVGTFRPLSIYETNVVAAEVMAELQTKPKTQQNAMMENSLLSIKILEKASTSDIDKTDYQVSALELQRLSAPEIEFLYAEYVSAVDKMNPRLEVLTKEQIDDLVLECKKKEDGLDLALAQLSFWQVWNIARAYLTPSEQPTDK